jgi:hypothetical protein
VAFLGLNSIDTIVDERLAALRIRDIAACEIDQVGLTRWLLSNRPHS